MLQVKPIDERVDLLPQDLDLGMLILFEKIFQRALGIGDRIGGDLKEFDRRGR